MLEPETLEKALQPDTRLVSVMMVNNELGTVQPLGELGKLIKKNGSLFHVDGAQGLGKVAIDFEALQIDLLSLSAHKAYGPKGTGALVVRSKPRIHLTPLIYGGGQQQHLRAGTEAPGLIAAFAKGAEFACHALALSTQKMATLRNQFLKPLQDHPRVHLNTDLQVCVPHILSLRFEGVDGESFLSDIANTLAISQAAACVSAETEPSHVLKAIGLTRLQADSSFRFSFGRMTTEGEVEHAAALVQKYLNQ
jgi:cysteine desulfurase